MRMGSFVASVRASVRAAAYPCPEHRKRDPRIDHARVHELPPRILVRAAPQVHLPPRTVQQSIVLARDSWVRAEGRKAAGSMHLERAHSRRRILRQLVVPSRIVARVRHGEVPRRRSSEHARVYTRAGRTESTPCEYSEYPV